MQNKMFRSSLQQDSQEFLRCLLMQLHDELALDLPAWAANTRSHDPSCDTDPSFRDSVVSCASRDSDIVDTSLLGSPGGVSESEGKSGPLKISPVTKKKGLSRLSLKPKTSVSRGSSQSLSQNSPTNQPRFGTRGPSSKLHGGLGMKGSSESINPLPPQQLKYGGSQISLESQNSDGEAVSGMGAQREDLEVYEVDVKTNRVRVRHGSSPLDPEQPAREREREGKGIGEREREKGKEKEGRGVEERQDTVAAGRLGGREDGMETRERSTEETEKTAQLRRRKTAG